MRLAIGLSLALSVACGVALGDAAADKKAVKPYFDKMAAAIKVKNFAAFAKLLAPDAVFRQPGGKETDTKGAVAGLQKQLAPIKIDAVQAEVIQATIKGDTADTIYTQTLDGVLTDAEKATHKVHAIQTHKTTLVKKGGAWLTKADETTGLSGTVDGQPLMIYLQKQMQRKPKAGGK